MIHLDFINKTLHQKNEAKGYDDEAMLEYYRIFPKGTKPLPFEPHLSDF